MSRLIKATLVLATLTLALWAGTAAVAANGQEKVTICHAAGQAGTTKFVTLTLAYPAVYGPAGHFYENGTPRAGHEEDYLGPCQGTSPNPSSSSTASPSPSSPAGPTSSPVASPTSSSPEPSPTGEASAPTPAPSLPGLPDTAMNDWTTADLLMVIGAFLIAIAAGAWILERGRRA